MRWRIVDLCQWLHAQFGVTIAEQTLSRVLRAMKYRKLKALPAADMEERERWAIPRLLHEARLPRIKTLDAFEFDRSGVAWTSGAASVSPPRRR